MASTLLLMRHGKAKAIAPDQDDFDRELTEAGKRSLAAMLPKMLAHVGKGSGRIEIWSSPAARTMQTANILAKALRTCGTKASGSIESVDALWEQDSTAFLEKVKDSQADTVIAVGHNPMIEELTARLTCARIPFSTGAIAAMWLNWQNDEESAASSQTSNEIAHRLLWFSQGPVSQHWRTLVNMEKMLRTANANVSNRLNAFFEDPSDIETMHKFRVSIRTLRSLVAFIKPWQDSKQNASIQENLKEVVGITSRLRELDVLAEQASAESIASPALVEFLERQASQEREIVADALSGKRVRKLLEHVNDEVMHVNWKRQYREEGLPARQVRSRFDAMADDLERDLEGLNLAEVEPTHDVRKSAKRVRYAAENFKDLIGDDAVEIAKGMADHQKNLGAVCDARVNIDIINELQDSEELPEQVAWDLALLRAQNETFLYTTLREQIRA